MIAGGFGAGKTTLVGAASEIDPLKTEEPLTAAGQHTDCLHGVEDKTTTTVLMDFGRITLREQGLVLLLFGTPGQERFRFLWESLTRGSLGAIVLADTRRLQDSYDSIGFFEDSGLPFAVAVNQFDGADRYHADEVKTALQLDPHVPVLLCDARDRQSARSVLIALVTHALHRSRPTTT
ncbi:ATP/GTP-binding protein [Streptomyces sp. NPDC005953]|uniref:GTP-binding protein n=1 Tax=Streptomyces sp. NPDC005953 TaxID=3156719 RepID=UPI0033E399FA